ncbi:MULTISPECIES: GNAT family N-acetyltransferase [unclassified Halomonas]|uniref:GNAT family N-acetyltransferase n=1 Tax=unclassified Halomonas TaxID=2609666 RepID=UPI0007DA062B|nr:MULTISPECIES: GNAT family N-acetyltransferase [unclassified Halomonas]MBT2787751.1 GNAT family N-acetyltransferase [Halomonas sp. ISL-106]MBT2796954.1 GNAT family N-acetyltransferase [Halomonas sp. ISL-104]OAL61506.1 hypothetical protein A6R74_14405 [Halomonas sp. ALS9]
MYPQSKFTQHSQPQTCARLAYAKYIQRIGREPAPMHADFASQIDKGYIDVATLDLQFAGYVVFYPDGDYMHLENVAVLPIYSGNGIGKQLIEHVERAAKEAGNKAVELYTNEAMTENIAMYAKLGYIEIGSRCEAGFNRIYFRKQL